ncbi:SRPBCC family protein [Arthrobacter sp. 35W]|uniref:SRPBCC family protein n=1 Tax=Arthrobacter sp. 35W TaxID=1132441 RepID=UPI0004252CB0|nr:SRPBCC domain-containing protein [Arthrobacter sp. 35W]
MDTKQISVHINADAEQVWRALREPALTAQWHGWQLDGLAEEIQQIYYSDAVESPDHLRLDLGKDDAFVLEPVADGTVLTIHHTKGTGEWAKYDADIVEGWQMFVQQLRFMLERHPHAERRTVYVDGQTTAATTLWEALGIDTGWLPDPGEDYEATLTTGQVLSGKVWYRTGTQLGLTVHSYAEHSDGLLILTEQAPLEGIREHSGALLIASTYGLGAAALDAVGSHWDAFMETHYPLD